MIERPNAHQQRGENSAENLSRILERKIGRIVERLHAAGIPVWVVGGVLRDALMGLSFPDVDLLVRCPSALLSGVIPEGVRVGKVVPALVLSPPKNRRGIKVQIATFTGSLERELSRRDFSVNALAMRLGGHPGEKREILDYYGGRSDLSREILRRPCLTRDPFSEDPVRVLRLVRFVSTLGFSVEPETLELAKRSAGALSRVAGERLRQEVLSLFSGAFLRRLPERVPGDLLGEILGRSLGVFPPPPSWKEGLPRILGEAARFSKNDPLFRLWILLEDSPGEMKKVLHARPWTRAEKRRILHFDRLASFFGKGPRDGPWSASDRSLLQNPDHRESVRRRVERRLFGAERKEFRGWSRGVVSDLCRPWNEVRDLFLESVKNRS